MLMHSSSLARLKLDSRTGTSSIIVDAVEQACDYFSRLSEWFVSSIETLNTLFDLYCCRIFISACSIDKDWESSMSSSLDRHRRVVIISSIVKMIEDFAALKYDKNDVFQVNEVS